MQGRLAGWWSAWKYVVVLLLLLGLSVWGNIEQYSNASSVRAEARADALDETLKITAGIAKDAQQDNKALADQVDAILTRAGRDLDRYSREAAKAPLPLQCAPGQGRMDEVNQGLGPETKR